MSQFIEISDDDDSFESINFRIEKSVLSSDADICELTSDEELPNVTVKSSSRQAIISNIFPTVNQKKTFTRTSPVPTTTNEAPKNICKMFIGGIEVHLPVNPYACQVALMAKVIAAMNTSQNCLLESPTGSGKTLALLCAALAWQKHKKDQISKENAAQYFSNQEDLNQVHNTERNSTPTKNLIDSPEKFFSKPSHGQKTIYDPVAEHAGTSSDTRQKHLKDSPEDQSDLVTIHKRRKLNASQSEDQDMLDACLTSENVMNPSQAGTSDLEQLLDDENPDNFVPIIYYGARTHKQLQQVIKEFGRTSYCGVAKMTILSSRDNTCIREYDRNQWSSKNDMCRACIKKTSRANRGEGATNCKYYDNKMALSRGSLPPAFDLKDLVAAGLDRGACPYYAARELAASADIVFCPYNYLIDPAIRSSMQIRLDGNVLVIDEAHNIEDICRDAATFTVTKDQLLSAIKELETVSGYRYSNQDVSSFINNLLKALQSWDQWFVNQTPLINQKPVNNNEASYVWDVNNFVLTLNNHNIGQQQYPQFQRDVELFSKQMRDDASTMLGVTQATSTLLDSLNTMLGYLFVEDGKHRDAFRPVLQRSLTTRDGATSWRSSHYNKSIERESVSLRVLCLSPAVVFGALGAARCVALASGTLAPLSSLHSELGTTFPLSISRKHIISADRVWVGTLAVGEGGVALRCSSRAVDSCGVQDALGGAVLRVARLTPHGVLCFLPSYRLMNLLVKRWQDTGVWQQLEGLKHVFLESRDARDHEDTMEDYYRCVETDRGAVLFAVYRGKVSEGMDFKDRQARAVIAVGIPYPNMFDLAVKEKMNYNNRYHLEKKLLPSKEWLEVQAYRALNQAVGRCVRHRDDWGAVLLVDARYRESPVQFTDNLSTWVRDLLRNNHHTYDSLVTGNNSLESFMKYMTLKEKEDI